MRRRRRLALTMTMTGPENTGPRPDCHEIVVREELQVMAEQAEHAVRALAKHLGIELQIEVHYYAQAHKEALWETVEREG